MSINNSKPLCVIMNFKSFIVGVTSLITAFIFCSCEHKITLPEIDEINFEEAPKELKLTDYFSNFHMVQLEQTEDCVFLFVDKIIDTEGTLIVMTAEKEVFCFERNTGKLRCKIGTRGEGPEEYLYLAGCIYNPDEKVVGIIDSYKNKMLCYDLNGVYKYQKEIPAKVERISSAELSKDGYLMLSHDLAKESGDKTFAYTVVAPDDSYFNFDPFSPVYVEGYVTPFAFQPMTVYKNGFTFQKFLNDTIFRLENGDIIPKYKLSMKKRFPSKELVAQIGPFNWVDIIKMCKSSGYFSGFGRIFETDRFILLEPMFPSDEGYFWIDKESEAGYRVPSTVNFSKELNLIIEGRSILSVKGSNSNELISCYESTLSKNGFVRQMDENPDLIPFSEELRTLFENADPQGNPIVIIYEH